ncbi:MAG: tyrosine-type recombinase/integrase [Candidatus Xenobia bacterium]
MPARWEVAAMAGNIEKRGESVWRVTVFLGYDPDTGKPERHRKTVHETKKDAERYLVGVLRERDLGKFSEPSKLRVSEFLDQWLQQAAKPRIRERTFQDYTDIVKGRLKPGLGNVPLN